MSDECVVYHNSFQKWKNLSTVIKIGLPIFWKWRSCKNIGWNCETDSDKRGNELGFCGLSRTSWWECALTGAADATAVFDTRVDSLLVCWVLPRCRQSTRKWAEWLFAVGRLQLGEWWTVAACCRCRASVVCVRFALLTSNSLSTDTGRVGIDGCTEPVGVDLIPSGREGP